MLPPTAQSREPSPQLSPQKVSGSNTKKRKLAEITNALTYSSGDKAAQFSSSSKKRHLNLSAQKEPDVPKAEESKVEARRTRPKPLSAASSSLLKTILLKGKT